MCGFDTFRLKTRRISQQFDEKTCNYTRTVRGKGLCGRIAGVRSIALLQKTKTGEINGSAAEAVFQMPEGCCPPLRTRCLFRTFADKLQSLRRSLYRR